MSKLGKKPITIPKDTKVVVENAKLIMTGPKGTRELTINDKKNKGNIKIEYSNIDQRENIIKKLIGN